MNKTAYGNSRPLCLRNARQPGWSNVISRVIIVIPVWRYGFKDIIRDGIPAVIAENFGTEKIRADSTSEQV